MNRPNQARRSLYRRCLPRPKWTEPLAQGQRQGLTARMCAVLIAGTILPTALPLDTRAAQQFTSADLEGTWHWYMLGVKGDLGGWGHGAFVFDANGSCIGSYITSTGHSESPSGTFSIDNDGIVRASNFGGLTSTFHGVMSNKKDMMVCTGTGGDSSCQLSLFVKTGATFATSDLEGAWVYHGLISGKEPDQVPGWYYYSMQVDQAGNALFSVVHDSQGNSHYTVRPCKFTVDETGVVTLHDPEGELPFWHGAMNPARDTIVAVATMAPGSIEDVRGYNLQVLEKQVAGAYSTSDLAGTWYAHGLVSGSSYNDWIGWYHLTLCVDRQGISSVVPGSYLNSFGETDQVSSGTTSITSDGIVTMSQLPSYHGIMSIGKDMCVATMNDGGGGYGLAVSVGRPAGGEFDFNMDGRVDFIDFSNFASHWLY
jgi:hypothetical protein